MIPGFLGANIEGVLHPDRKERVNGNWSSLPKSIADLGNSPEKIFASYFDLQEKVGKKEMANIPYGAIAMWTMADKLGCGIQQLLAGARKFKLDQLSRNDIFAANRETARETGITHITDANNESALRILAA
jgi:hypothetical protein